MKKMEVQEPQTSRQIREPHYLRGSAAPAACEIEFTPLLLPIELCLSLSSSAASCSPYLRIRDAH